MTERELALDVVQRLRDAGHEALWAGGCVRDEILGRTPNDYDVATSATPNEVQNLFRRTIAIGASFGVIEVLGPRRGEEMLSIEVATFRSDGAYTDGRHPDEVTFSTAEKDAQRRDFTINGMFKDPLTDRIIDYVGGKKDLENRALRAIGDPRERFSEDKLRMLRAVRMATRFELGIDPHTADAIREMASQIEVVSAERISDELHKMLVHPRRRHAMETLMDLNLFDTILPELVSMKEVPYGPPDNPTGDLWQHVILVLNHLPEDASFSLAFAALLHDVGKRRTMKRDGDRYTFYNHEHVGKAMSAKIGRRLKLSNEERERIEWLVEHHQYLCDVRRMRTAKLKRTLCHPGIGELLDLHRADALASERSIDHVEYCETLLQEWSEDDLNPDTLVTGHDLTRLGLEPGPLFKELLEIVRDAQLDGTIRSTKQAVELLESQLAERGFVRDECGQWH